MTRAGLSPIEQLAPHWLAHRFEEAGDAIHFVDQDRAARSAVPFLTDQYLSPTVPKVIDRRGAIAAAPPTAPVHFIFHSGFCCSTLVAACLDRPGLATAFSEPVILNDIVGWRRRGASPAAVGEVLGNALGLLARPFEGDQAAVVKPSNIVNGLAAAMLQMTPKANALVIHAPIEDFLVSIAKKGLDGRLWVRELFLSLRREGLVEPLGFNDEAFFGQTDLQIAAVAWLAQQTLFEQLIGSFPGRVRSIDSRAFLEDPLAALRALTAHFGLAASDTDFNGMAEGPLRRDSKSGRDYGSDQRANDYADARAAHGDEIVKVVKWAEVVAETVGLPTRISSPLL